MCALSQTGKCITKHVQMGSLSFKYTVETNVYQAMLYTGSDSKCPRPTLRGSGSVGVNIGWTDIGGRLNKCIPDGLPGLATESMKFDCNQAQRVLKVTKYPTTIGESPEPCTRF